MIDRGIFTSVGDLRRKLMRYIRAYERLARPIRLELPGREPPNPYERNQWDSPLDGRPPDFSNTPSAVELFAR